VFRDLFRFRYGKKQPNDGVSICSRAVVATADIYDSMGVQVVGLITKHGVMALESVHRCLRLDELRRLQKDKVLKRMSLVIMTIAGLGDRLDV
jgi:hypothetical protein